MNGGEALFSCLPRLLCHFLLFCCLSVSSTACCHSREQSQREFFDFLNRTLEWRVITGVETQAPEAAAASPKARQQDGDSDRRGEVWVPTECRVEAPAMVA